MVCSPKSWVATQPDRQLPTFCHADGCARAFVADQQTRSAFNYDHEGLGPYAGAGVQHAKLVTAWLLELDIGGELA
jgi:hypothetical protein